MSLKLVINPEKESEIEIEFKVEDYAGLPRVTPSPLITQRTNFWGVRGASEIVSPGVTPEKIEVDVWITDQTFQPTALGIRELYAYLATLEGLRGSHGRLEHLASYGNESVEQDVQLEWDNCTFEGFVPIPLEGQTYPMPVKIVGTEEQWAQAGVLTFTRLSDA